MENSLLRDNQMTIPKFSLNFYHPSSNKCNKQLPEDYKMLILHLSDQKKLLSFDIMLL